MQKRKKSLGSSLIIANEIEPLTDNQEKVFDDWDDGYQIIMTGYAGTGKSFLSLYLALSEIENPKNPYQQIIIIRSDVATRRMGFLPGDVHEKAAVYEEPYESMVNEIYGRADAYDILKKKRIIDFKTTSYLRGITYNNSIIIVDEIQNMTDSELNTILTRFGNDTRFILCGDFRQTDLNVKQEKSGFYDIINILKNIKSVKMTDFGIDDIVRSGFVRDYIIEREKYYHDQ